MLESIPALGIHRIENGDRRVDVDDLAAIAVALHTTPSALMMPSIEKVPEDGLVEVTGWGRPITASLVWDWLTGRRPLIKVSYLAFIERSWPRWEREPEEERWRTEKHAQTLAALRRKNLDDDVQGDVPEEIQVMLDGDN